MPGRCPGFSRPTCMSCSSCPFIYRSALPRCFTRTSLSLSQYHHTIQHTTEKRMGFNISAGESCHSRRWTAWRWMVEVAMTPCLSHLLHADAGEVRWTYTLEDGRCTDSMALNTAKQYGIDRTIVDRAEALGAYFDQCCRGGSRAEIELLQQPQEQLRFAGDQQKEDQQQSGQLQHLSSADNDDSAGIDTEIDIDRDVLPAVRHLVSDSPLYVVKRGFEPSPALEGLSCTYILLLSTLTKAQKVGQ